MNREGREIFKSVYQPVEHTTNTVDSDVPVVVVKPFLSLCFAFIFVRAILRLKLNVANLLERGGGAGVRVRVKNCQMQVLFCSVPVPPAITPNHDPMNRLL